MAFDYFYGPQAEQFAFYRIPKVLFTDGRFGNISTDAKTLYGILLDRMNLSAANGWLDQAGKGIYHLHRRGNHERPLLREQEGCFPSGGVRTESRAD
ncbi:MAG: replication initiator protein A [Blautia sp.]